MIWMALESAWHFVFGWAGVYLLVGFAAVAVAVLEPPIVAVIIPDLRKWAIATAVVAFTCTGLIAYGYHNGLAEKQRQWNEALANEASSGAQILDDAERAARDDTPERLRNDSWNRGRRTGAAVH